MAAEHAPIRLGLTTRVVSPEGYTEPRDALAQDWGTFLGSALPGVPWMPLPNLGADRIIAHCETWGINALVLTGGDDPGATPLRDETETALLEWAVAAGHPVLGICRGMQMMAIWAGGQLKPVSGHVASRHAVEGRATTVNSFHGLALTALPQGFETRALSPDGAIEAVEATDRPLHAIMWHPEREPAPDPADITLFRKVFL